ncbi:hypothetical protein LTR53_003425 [Teratosphaeriaceae sp. CCFEE 6253]|nr:hypothetical protein LTR53_003425 [Teratosphaeriaceae sp. CCFEE 6253]
MADVWRELGSLSRAQDIRATSLAFPLSWHTSVAQALAARAEEKQLSRSKEAAEDVTSVNTRNRYLKLHSITLLPIPSAIVASPAGLLHRPNSQPPSPPNGATEASADMSYADMAKKGPKQSDEDVCIMAILRGATKADKRTDTDDDDAEMPHALPEIAHDDPNVHSLDSLSSGDQTSSDLYADQQQAVDDTKAAAKETAQDAKRGAKDFGKRAENSANDLANQGEKKGKEVKREAEKKGKEVKKEVEEIGQDAKEEWEELSSDAKRNYDKAANKASKEYDEISTDVKRNYTKAADIASEQWEEVSTDAKRNYNKAAEKAQQGLEKAKIQGKKGYAEVKREAGEAEEWAEKNRGNPVVIGNLMAMSALGGVLGTNAYHMHKAGTLTWNVFGAWAGAVGLFAFGDYIVSQWFFRNKYPTK